MAEIFGTVASALSVAALFNNCVDCFEYIQLGRHFGQDFGRCQLRLDIAKTRLSRWGQAVSINDVPRFNTEAAEDELSKHVRAIMEEIVILFQAIEKSSKRYEISATREDLSRLEHGDLQPVARTLHNRLSTLARQRQKQTGLLKKVTWALYDGKNLERLVEQVSGFVKDLESLIPVESARRALVELEIEEIGDEPSLLALQEAAANTDELLSESVEEKIKGITGQNSVKTVVIEDGVRVRVGNEWSEETLARGSSTTDPTTNTADSIAAKGLSRVHVGHQYGGKSIFDD